MSEYIVFAQKEYKRRHDDKLQDWCPGNVMKSTTCKEVKNGTNISQKLR